MKREFAAEKDSRTPHLKVINDSPDPPPMENDFFEAEKENNPFAFFLNRSEADPSGPNQNTSSKENPFLSSFLTELIHSIKNTLISIKTVSQLSAEKFNDADFRKYSQRSISEDIKNIDSVLNSLLNYIHINTPITKSNTLSLILEEVLEANEKQIQNKKIKIIKKCEKDLPETFIHDEQVRFILNSVLQYALLSTPFEGTIGFLLKSFDFLDETPGKNMSPERNGGYIEAAVGYIRDKESTDPSKNDLARSSIPKEEAAKLILQLVEEILQKNHGRMTYEVDPKKPRGLITLRFPIERRKVVYYEPISI